MHALRNQYPRGCFAPVESALLPARFHGALGPRKGADSSRCQPHSFFNPCGVLTAWWGTPQFGVTHVERIKALESELRFPACASKLPTHHLAQLVAGKHQNGHRHLCSGGRSDGQQPLGVTRLHNWSIGANRSSSASKPAPSMRRKPVFGLLVAVD